LAAGADGQAELRAAVLAREHRRGRLAEAAEHRAGRSRGGPPALRAADHGHAQATAGEDDSQRQAEHAVADDDSVKRLRVLGAPPWGYRHGRTRVVLNMIPPDPIGLGVDPEPPQKSTPRTICQ